MLARFFLYLGCCFFFFPFEIVWLVVTVGFKAMLYSICLFRFLDGLQHFDVGIVPCLRIFLGIQAPTLLISGTGKGEGRNIGM